MAKLFASLQLPEIIPSSLASERIKESFCPSCSVRPTLRRSQRSLSVDADPKFATKVLQARYINRTAAVRGHKPGSA